MEEKREGSKFGWGVLGFFFPVVGLILFLVWLKNKKKAAKASGIGALIGFVLGSIFLILSFFGILSIFSFSKDLSGERDILVLKALPGVGDYSIYDSKYEMNWSEDFLTNDVRNYHAVDKDGKRLFTIQETIILKKDDMIHTHKIITNTEEELTFDDYFPELIYDKYYFYYKNNVVIFNTGTDDTGYYFYDLDNKKLYHAFVNDEAGNEGLRVADITMNDTSITFKVEFNIEDVKVSSQNTIYKKVLNGEYENSAALDKNLKALNLDPFVVSKTITYNKKNGKYNSEPVVESKNIYDLYNEMNPTISTPENEVKTCNVTATKGERDYEYDFKHSCNSTNDIINVFDDDGKKLFTFKYKERETHVLENGEELGYINPDFYKVGNSIVFYSAICSPGLCYVYVYNTVDNTGFRITSSMEQEDLMVPYIRTFEFDENKNLVLNIKVNESAGFEGYRTDPRVTVLGKIRSCEVTDLDKELKDNGLLKFPMSKQYVYENKNGTIVKDNPKITVTSTIEDLYKDYASMCSR